MRRRLNAAVLLACLVPIGLGLSVMGLGARNLWLGHASTRWPTAQGTVIESATEATGSAGSPTYSARVLVRYRVGSQDYTTDTHFFGQLAGSADSAEADLIRLRHPVGTEVPVSHHPSDPALAALTPGIHADALWLPGAGLGFVLPGLMALALSRGGPGRMGGMGIGLALFATIFCLVGMAMLTGGGIRLWRAQASASWPTAPGVILSSTVDSSTSSTRTRGGTTQSTSYSAQLVYSYEAAGRTRYGNTRRFGSLAGAGEEWAGEIAERYPTDAPVRVAYSPDRPDLSVLEPGVSSEAWWLPGAGLAFLLFGAAVFLFGIPALTR